MVNLQVTRHDELALQAEANRIAVVPVVPNRGLIVDRNGVVLANNYSAYTLEISPRRSAAELEALIEELSSVVEIAPRDRRRFKRLQEEMKGAETLPIRTKLTDEEVARFTARRFQFPGVEVKARLFRNYPLGDTGSHLLGYIGRVNQYEKAAMEDWPEEQQANYKGTEYIGKLGLEQAYESELHGTTGFEEIETSAGGRAVRRLRSHPATPGNKLVCPWTSGCRPWSRSCSATAAARWWPSTRAMARCWPLSACPPSTRTCLWTASMPRAGASSMRASTVPC
jgi:penicillin-binding protein 2